MACVPSEVAALADRLHLLAMLATNPAAMQGLNAVVRAGRRNGLNTATFAGVTLSKLSSGRREGAGAVQEGQHRQRTTQGASDWQPSPNLSSPRPKVGSATEEGRREVCGQEDGAQICARHAPGQQVCARAAAAAATVRGRGGAPAVSGASSRNSRHFTGDAGGAAPATATRIRMSTT